jgi:aryl-alcohol dehydrogenase-like predicted oxidoreductase
VKDLRIGSSGLRVSRIGPGIMNDAGSASLARPIEETMDALQEMVCAPARARYHGASSMYAWQFAKAQPPPGRPAGPGSS